VLLLLQLKENILNSLFDNVMKKEIFMKVLNQQDVQLVSGGDIGITVNSNVPQDEIPFFINVLGQILTGQIDAEGFGKLISENAANFTNIPIQSIKIGNFTIIADK
jgi:hypothetical protein